MNIPTNKFANLRFPAADIFRLSSPGGFHARDYDAVEIKFCQTDAFFIEWLELGHEHYVESVCKFSCWLEYESLFTVIMTSIEVKGQQT